MKLSVVSSSGLPPSQTLSAPSSNWRRAGAEGELGPEAAGGPCHPVRLPHWTTAPGLPPLCQRQTLPSDSPTPPGWPHTAEGGAAGPVGREPAGGAGGGSRLVESVSVHISEPDALLFSVSTIAPTLCDSRPRPLSQVDHCDITVMMLWTCCGQALAKDVKWKDNWLPKTFLWAWVKLKLEGALQYMKDERVCSRLCSHWNNYAGFTHEVEKPLMCLSVILFTHGCTLHLRSPQHQLSALCGLKTTAANVSDSLLLWI